MPASVILIAISVVIFLIALVAVFAVMLYRWGKGKPKAPAARITATAAPLQPQRSSMFDALDAGGPGAQAKIEGAMVDYAVREKLRQFSEATAPLMAPAPNAASNPPANPA
jgi:hypothetical protein